MISKSTPLYDKTEAGPGWRMYLILYFGGLVICLFMSTLQNTPGYMDAEYYVSGGLRIANGLGWREPYLWNYLNQPTSLPAPAFTYWMPFSSLLAAIFPFLFKLSTFWLARIPFILLSGLIAPLTAWIGWNLYHSRKGAFVGGLLAIFPGLYLPYLGTADTFTLYILLGAVFIQSFSIFENRLTLKRILTGCFTLGLITGAMHLARADGILLFFVAGLLVFIWIPKTITDASSSRHKTIFFLWAAGLVCLFGGYILVMLPWYARNISLFGSFFPPGSSLTLWLNQYDAMFSFPPSGLTLQNWFRSGLETIVRARIDAFLLNIQTLLVIQGGIFLWPLSLMGLWKARRDIRIQAAAVVWLVIFFFMTIVFPLAGSRGGYFHSGAAIQILVWASAPAGLEQFIHWGQKLRGWNPIQGWKFFSAGLVVISILVMGLFSYKRVVGTNFKNPVWNESLRTNALLGSALDNLGVDAKAVIMVNNPPGFYYATGRPAVVIPTNGQEAVIEAAHQFHASVLLLDINNNKSLTDLYQKPADYPGFQYLGTAGNTRIYAIEPK